MFWTKLHLITLIPTLIIMVIIGIILRKVLRDKSLKIRMIPFKIFAILLIIGEIIKQYLSIKGGYNLFNLPLHVCSMFLLFIPLMAFYKGKYSNTINSITVTLCTLLTICMLIMPNQIYGYNSIKDYFNDYFCFHTVTFHNIVVFELILILFLDLYNKEQFTKYKNIFIFGCCYVLIASTAAQLLKTNYSNFYYCQIPALQKILDYITSYCGNLLGKIIHIIIVGSTQLFGFTFSYIMAKRIILLKNKLTTH